MARRRAQVAIVTYNGIDGACAAAMAMLEFPKAEVLVSSARRIGQTLGRLADRSNPPLAVHVCGLGAYCDWEEVARPCRTLSRKRVPVTWYCGRGYLEPERETFADVVETVFLPATSNTAAVCEHLGLAGEARAPFLLDLALHDARVEAEPDEPDAEQQFWLDLIDGSIAEYFKYDDRDRYAATVVKLATNQREAADERLVAVYHRSRFKYVMGGRSPAMRRLRERISRCAPVDESVLITGESGVGKEHVAHLIHERSDRAAEIFLPVNCAGFAGNEGLANSVLFGHRKGAFTGAIADREGKFAAASGGVLFLDELGELPLEVQAKLLRVLEDKLVVPEGADEPTRDVDVRVIAATNRDLPAMIRDGAFRADLFHRLATLRVHVPPVRERPEDMDAVIAETLARLTDAGFDLRLSPAARRDLRAYDWPGNVRQLIKVLQRAAYLGLSVAEVLDEERSLGALTPNPSAATPDALLPASLADVEPLAVVRDRYVQRVLELHNGNRAAAARALGIAKNTLKKYAGQD